MFQKDYYIDKASNTFADNLAAFGLAFVLNGVAAGRAQVRLEDRGPAYAVVCEPGLRAEWVEGCAFFTGAPFLITYDQRSKTKVIKGTDLDVGAVPEAGGSTAIDYEAEKQKNQEYFDWRRALTGADRQAAAQGELRGPPPPHPQWDVFRAVNPAALQAYNGLLAEWWRGQAAFPDLLKAVLQLARTTPNDPEGAEKAWAGVCKERGWPKPKDATLAQLFNPIQGKGTSSPAAVWRAPNNLKGFWLLEWLKVAGMFEGGLTRAPRGTKDRKTFVLAPQRLDWSRHSEVMREFRSAMAVSMPAVQMDILAALRYTQALLGHYEKARPEDLEAELFGHSAGDLVSGLQTAYYKNLGNAAATMNIAQINLPRWVAPRRAEDLKQLREALQEHADIVRGLDETRGDQFDLLCRYRDFLSANDLKPFFEFTTAYSGFLISRYERRQYARPFTTTTLEVLFMNSEQPIYSRIVQDEGFKNIAYAIRHSTVVPQGRKARGARPAVEVRYGLGQQLARKAAYPAEFLAEIAEFVHLYNAENAQLRENGREPFRKNVTTADLDALTGLVDEFGSKVVCNLLVAYGYAREPYEPRDEEGEQAEAAEEAADAAADDETGPDEDAE